MRASILGAKARRPRFFRIGAAFLLTAIINFLILAHFYDRAWIPGDEGQYAHVAERLLDGEVLHADIEESHLGLMHLVNAASFAVFGRKLVSMRYPMAFVTFIQSCLVFFLFLPQGLLASFTAALTMTSFGFVEVGTPTPNLYSLFFTMLIVCVLTWLPRTFRWRLEIMGFLLMIVILFRQLSGFFVGMALLAYLFTEPQEKDSRKPWIARLVLGLLSVALLLYFWKSTDAEGIVLFGIWPLLILIWAFQKTTVSGISVFKMVSRLILGGILALLPVIVYHAIHHSWGAWFEDAFLRPLKMTSLPHLKMYHFHYYLIAALWCFFVNLSGIPSFLNGIYLVVLPLTGAVNGGLLLLSLRRRKIPPKRFFLPFMAVFWAACALMLQLHYYLYYTVCFSLVSILWLLREWPRKWSFYFCGFLILLSGTALSYHAGQPSLKDALVGVRHDMVKDESLTRDQLWHSSEVLGFYQEVLGLIKEETRSEDTIFAIPSNPEFYFLADRKNPFPFWNIALHWLTRNDVQGIIWELKDHPPRLVIHNFGESPYNKTPFMGELIEFIEENYTAIREIDKFRIYRLNQRMDTAR